MQWEPPLISNFFSVKAHELASYHQAELNLAKERHIMVQEQHPAEQLLVTFANTGMRISVQYEKAKHKRTRVLTDLWSTMGSVEEKFYLVLAMNRYPLMTWWDRPLEQIKNDLQQEVQQMGKLYRAVQSLREQVGSPEKG
jgi:hypothetical protein